MNYSYPGSPYQFFKQICLDENGLLCGIQDLLDSINQLSSIVTENTISIQNIEIGINDINEEIIEINTSIDNITTILSNTQIQPQANNIIINDIVIPETIETLPNQIVATNNNISLNKIYKVILKTKNSPTRIVKNNNYIKTINGFDTVVNNTNIKTKTVIEPKKIVKQLLPELRIPFGWIYPDGSKSCITPEQYYDSKGNIIKPKNQFIGKINKSVCYK